MTVLKKFTFTGHQYLSFAGSRGLEKDVVKKKIKTMEKLIQNQKLR